MANYELSFDSVSIPNNSDGITVTVEEDSDNDGVTNTTETITLSDGVTAYQTSSDNFSGSGQVALSFDLGPVSDKTVTSSNIFPVDVNVISVDDYNKYKELTVDSVSGTPTVSKAQPIYLTSGDDATTGNGEIVLDWSKISDASDLGIFDQNDNLLDYEIEELDTSNKTGLIWTYNDWVRDGTVQAKLAYGNGPEDRSMSGAGANPWDNAQSARLVQHFQDDPLTATDSSSNLIDSTINGAVASNGHYAGGASFDGVDDYINFGDTSFSFSNQITVIATFNRTNSKDSWLVAKDDDSNGREFAFGSEPSNNRETQVQFSGNPELVDDTDIDDGNFHILGFTKNGTSSAKLFRDGINTDTNDSPTAISDTTAQLNIGRRSYTGAEDYTEGTIDEVRVYTSVKSESWFTAEYDASAKAGQIFFSQSSAKGDVQPPAGSIPDTGSNGVMVTDNNAVILTI